MRATLGGKVRRDLTVAVFTVIVAATVALGFDYSGYARVLEKRVDGHGRVDYAGIAADSAPLDSFLSSLGSLEEPELKSSDSTAQIAFWVNAYNALALKTVLEHYPIKSSFLNGLLYPASSIRQIGGAFNGITHMVLGRGMTLDDIEHDVLRREFDEPRIHLALVCAAQGCPPLRPVPYRGDSLDIQLESQARRFLADLSKFRIDRQKRRVYLSAIFKWYGEDFIPSYLNAGPLTGFDRQQRAVLHFIAERLGEQDRNFILAGEYSVDYLDYDWTLNDQK